MLKDQTVKRIYGCRNKECCAEISVEQMMYDDFISICPFCGEDSLLIDFAETNISVVIDSKKPKTLGTLGEKNYELAKRDGKDTGIKEKKPPFWRKNKKINYDVLKNPRRYVETGNT